MDCCLQVSSIHGILQERTLEWVTVPSLGDLPDSGIEPESLTSPTLAGGFFTTSGEDPTTTKVVVCVRVCAHVCMCQWVCVICYFYSLPKPLWLHSTLSEYMAAVYCTSSSFIFSLSSKDKLYLMATTSP